jgi:hypothetical protein
MNKMIFIYGDISGDGVDKTMFFELETDAETADVREWLKGLDKACGFLQWFDEYDERVINKDNLLRLIDYIGLTGQVDVESDSVIKNGARFIDRLGVERIYDKDDPILGGIMVQHGEILMDDIEATTKFILTQGMGIPFRSVKSDYIEIAGSGLIS